MSDAVQSDSENVKRAKDRKRKQERIIDEVGCDGLINGYATITRTGERVRPSQVNKLDGPFHCAKCLSDCVHRRCVNKADHFAHKARLSPVVERGETRLHRRCKEEICNDLKRQFPDGKWETERPIEASQEKNRPRLIPDVSGRIRGIPIAVEVQASSMTIPRIIKRASAYHSLGIAILWIVPLKQPLGEENFRPRLFERYFHSIYFGRTYYWTTGNGSTVNPVHYGIAERYIERSEWYDSGGNPQSAGGFFKAYKTIKAPKYGESLEIGEDFYKNPRNSFTPWNERKAIPELTTWQDKRAIWWDVREQNDFEDEYQD